MSYDLNFWAYENESEDNDHLATYERLSEGDDVEGLRLIAISSILERVREVFSDCDWIEQDNGFSWESEHGSFQISTTPQLFRVDCYGMDGEDMNRFVDIAAEFGLPLYDPQEDERYDDWLSTYH